MKRELLVLALKTVTYLLAWDAINARFRTQETQMANLRSEVRRNRAEERASNALLLPPPHPN